MVAHSALVLQFFSPGLEGDAERECVSKSWRAGTPSLGVDFRYSSSVLLCHKRSLPRLYFIATFFFALAFLAGAWA
ncbi:hypothetical protein LC653_42180 [Nostoc sp. CHAB 5784]|uniref:hypothetical protein n=1 Tax=Nostoc mirabile TaxID=2907820 RepID=UPI001E4FA24B|nr:hypothetical protein [Nostoc mirabile]MCC5670228.1 hypothetical protein [Nostoc mirabile CHAB5784]